MALTLVQAEPADVHYLQSQNGNLFSAEYFTGGPNETSEFKSLRRDIPSSIPWCTEALGKRTCLPRLPSCPGTYR